MKKITILLGLALLTACAGPICETRGYEKGSEEYVECVSSLKEFGRKAGQMSENMKASRNSNSSATNACVYNSSTNSYQTCYNFSMGKCMHYGLTCKP